MFNKWSKQYQQWSSFSHFN